MERITNSERSFVCKKARKLLRKCVVKEIGKEKGQDTIHTREIAYGWLVGVPSKGKDML